MHLLGHHLPDHKLVRIALRSFYGISHNRASRLLARLSIPEQATVATLTERQITALSSYLSSPSTSLPPPPTPVVPPHASEQTRQAVAKLAQEQKENSVDLLDDLKIESDLRRQIKADINHHRIVGTYRGRRHAMGYPVRGQGTRTNARTAKKFNSLNRRMFS